MALRQIFARNLRYWRLRRGLSQEALAHSAGTDRTYISSLERQRYSASIDVIEAIARVLEVEPAALFAPEPPED
ncbi:MAG TPA: helix-turn-helix transcriptional regulator [Novosphingobium sp.]|jgi:transcriptional regulator with XRE-family HTH domain|nr:helix-turn-helix transcriptional regulator [Novosphingobium sp.]